MRFKYAFFFLMTGCLALPLVSEAASGDFKQTMEKLQKDNPQTYTMLKMMYPDLDTNPQTQQAVTQALEIANSIPPEQRAQKLAELQQMAQNIQSDAKR